MRGSDNLGYAIVKARATFNIPKIIFFFSYFFIQ